MKPVTTFSILLLFILVLISNSNFAQNVRNIEPPVTLYTNESGSFVFDTVVNINGVSKTELYKRAKSWITSNIRTSDNTVVLDDKDSSEIKTDATIDLKYNGRYSNFKILLSFKENKCKIVFASFILGCPGCGEQAFEATKVKWIYKEFDKRFPLFKDTLIKSLYKESKSDW